MLYPFWHEIMLSFSSLEASMKGGIFLWPKGFNLDTYKSVFKNPNIYTGFRTTIIVTIAGTALGTLLTAMTAYPLSKSRLRGGKVLMTLVLFTMIFSAGMIPSFLLIQNIGLMDNILALILPGLVSAYNCIIMKSFFLSIPESLEESARIDGATDLRIFFSIILPLSKATIATIALFTAVGYWNDYFSTVLYIRSVVSGLCRRFAQHADRIHSRQCSRQASTLWRRRIPTHRQSRPVPSWFLRCRSSSCTRSCRSTSLRAL